MAPAQVAAISECSRSVDYFSRNHGADRQNLLGKILSGTIYNSSGNTIIPIALAVRYFWLN
jgi:hypothetical protein